MRVLIAASGSYGDVHPFLAIGRELKRRGHDVRFFTSSYFDAAVIEAGLVPVGIGSVESYQSTVRHPDAFHPRKGFRIIAQANLELLEEAYRRMDEHVLPGETIAVGSTLALAARLLQERRGIPTATAHLAPSIFRSAENPPRYDGAGTAARFPPFLNRIVFWILDKLFIDPEIAAGFNRFRAELGLPPVKRMFHEWIHEADLLLGLFPEWFGRPQPGWPSNLRLTGFPLYDGADGAPLSHEVEEFLKSGAPPVLFTPGTAATSEASFFRESLQACRESGARALFLTRYREQLPAELPSSVRHFDYLRFSKLLPRVAAIVHHGGIGTSSQALAAGIPQLVRPLAYDQFDNAYRLETAGVARVVASKRYRAREVEDAIRDLISSEEVRTACASARRKIEGYDAVSATCDVILKELG
jgi:UDP:flavonoid glycosyltransferase YjiC (YdhE family)